MNPHHDQEHLEQSVDVTRRRLAKAGLAVPAVLGVLASRPVLGGPLHHCTPSGHISGFASPNPGVQPCSSLGQPPNHYRASKANWPGGTPGPFLNPAGNPRLFRLAPQGMGSFHGNPVRFADAYQVRRLSDNFTRDATVWDVLAGCNVNETTGVCVAGWVLEAKPGFNSDIGLGQEAITAAMNALTGYPTNFPISIQQVVEMFNAVVVSGGLYQVTSTNQWNAAEVKFYLNSLHT
ncbi:MAG: hypothetical protein NZ524_00525 [Thiobacillaceae bacterium]|nr:hypothetical protein [Thiobacillaceae bacterium]